MNDAQFYEKNENESVLCQLCPNACVIAAGRIGRCGVRKNEEGTLEAIGYGKVSSLALDPIEKKPLYRFHPGSMILSLGGYGCNLNCPFCQNYDISHEYGTQWESGRSVSAQQVIELAQQARAEGNIGVAYTYNEPLVGYEFVSDCTQLVADAGLANVLVTNGYINQDPLLEILPRIDAMNVDLKGFSEAFYRKLGGHLEPVRKTIEAVFEHCHLEITTLVVPGENDSLDEMDAQARWIASLDPQIPLHLTRFFPRYKYADKSPTSRESLFKLRDVARQHLAHVYVGNI
ncbi:MAG: AmmeMemoRadiSam system radical SAM enzyme [Actinomycetia bacterium]|nr:AmmeMemoRadiSam system radical SAM enzyme [Actinomycetes bacterium]